MATAHGAGLMLAPVALASGQGGFGRGLALLGIHTLAMFLVLGLVALAVFEIFGVGLLRRAWINLDLLWAIGLILAGGATLVTGVTGGQLSQNQHFDTRIDGVFAGPSQCRSSTWSYPRRLTQEDERCPRRPRHAAWMAAALVTMAISPGRRAENREGHRRRHPDRESARPPESSPGLPRNFPVNLPPPGPPPVQLAMTTFNPGLHHLTWGWDGVHGVSYYQVYKIDGQNPRGSLSCGPADLPGVHGQHLRGAAHDLPRRRDVS